MGNHRLEHHWSCVIIAPSIVSKVVVVETHKQHAKIGVIQSLDASITTTWVEMVVAPNIDVVRRGILIGFVTKLGSRSCGVSVVRNLNQSSALPTITTRVVGTLQMVFTNLMTTTHVNKTTNWTLMSSMVVGGYKNANVTNPRGGY